VWLAFPASPDPATPSGVPILITHSCLVNLTGSSQKDILPTLDILPRIEEGNPECFCHCFRPMLFIERIDSIPLKIRD
jgi:hypothetical protein